jgi:radical SAM protein with 4Fe4S-binding SPASM domain
MIIQNFCENTFFEQWKNSPKNPFSTLELIVNGKCELQCKYCYVNLYKKEYFPPGTEDESKIIENLYKIGEWIEKNKFNNIALTLFSGELLSQDIGRKVFKIISGFPISRCSIPSNMNFIMRHEEEIDDILANSKFPIYISASVDGKYMEGNRPGVKRDDIFYDKVFSFCARHKHGFHPMIYADGIERWKENFDWFMQMFEKHEMDPHKSLYLLEVRNDNWSKEACKHFEEFLKYVIRKETGGIEGVEDLPYNILRNLFMELGRGLPCSIQTSLHVRLGDLKTFPCHRLMYDQLATAQFDNDMVLQDLNASLGIATYSFSGKYLSCKDCVINELCIGGCLGSQLEVMKDMFIPIPSVCRMFHSKILSILSELNNQGKLLNITKNISYKKAEQIKFLLKEKII